MRTAFAELRNDILMREEAEAEVLRLNSELEQRAVRRTKELHAAQFAAEQVLDLTDSAYWRGYLGNGVLVGNTQFVALHQAVRNYDFTLALSFRPTAAAQPVVSASLFSAWLGWAVAGQVTFECAWLGVTAI